MPEKNAAAKALLSKHFGPSSTATASGTSRSATSANPKKLAQQRQIAVMKMRHKAKPADPKDTAASVPVGERLHVKVRKAEEDIAAERILWFKKVCRSLSLAGQPPLDPAYSPYGQEGRWIYSPHSLR